MAHYSDQQSPADGRLSMIPALPHVTVNKQVSISSALFILLPTKEKALFFFMLVSE